MSQPSDKINLLQAELEEGLRQLDAGEGREIDFDQLLRDFRSKFKRLQTQEKEE